MTINWRDAGILDAIALTAQAGPEDLLLAGLDLATVGSCEPRADGEVESEPQQARFPDLHHPGIFNNQFLLSQPVDNYFSCLHVPG